MEEKKIFDYAVGENLEAYVLIKSAEVRIAKNGKKFIAFSFADRSGEISAKFWDASDEDIARLTAGKVVRLNGKREVYQNNPQVKIFSVVVAGDDEPNDPALYLKTAPESRGEMVKSLTEFVFAIENNNLSAVVKYLLKKYEEEFFTFPAAKKNHHAFAGGLAYHTLSILRLAKTIALQYPGINTDLLYAGAILHDLGKVKELSGALATTYTAQGNLLGHISLMDEEIYEAAHHLELDPNMEDLVLLRHMILAHHGLLEYGSPVRPKLMEAEILHQLDNLDASIQMMRDALAHTEPGKFSERIFGLDNRQFYKSMNE